MKNLEPKEVWGYFDEILKIPRLSKHEERIIEYLRHFAAEHQLEFSIDQSGNCLIKKPAAKGYEDRETVILQSHVDMVGEKLMHVEHDFMRDPIKAVIKDGWVTAEGTTLGADDGIGIAASLAILESENIEHGPLECLFTVDEETGMTGAFGIEEGFMEGKILLNLDSEDEGEIFIGCAGGIDTIARLKKDMVQVPEGSTALMLTIQGLQGGHSGDEIHKGFGNAIKIMNRCLWNLDKEFDIRVASIQGGKLRNAIPREATAVITCLPGDEKMIRDRIRTFGEIITRELKSIEPGFELSTQENDLPELCFAKTFQSRLIQVLYACPHGVIAWSQDIEGLVETSTNLAVIHEIENGYIEIITSQRSSSESAKKDISDRLEALFLLAGSEVRHSDGYPGWNPDMNSPIRKISEHIYKNLFGKEPEVKAIHAGLECGLFLTKYPDLDMISFGPTIKGAHTPDERINIESVSKFWLFLLELMKQVPLRN